MALLDLDPRMLPPGVTWGMGAGAGAGPAAPGAPVQLPSAARPPPLHVGQLRGRLAEIVAPPAGGASTLAAALVLQAQREGEPVAWVQPEHGSLYPPDLAAAGVQLPALLVVHVGTAATAQPRLRAAELLLRSGGFGLVVLDLMGAVLPAGLAWQHRLQSWAREHQAAVVLLARPRAGGASLGPLVALQLQPELEALGGARFALHGVVRKNKLGTPQADWTLMRRGPDGLILP